MSLPARRMKPRRSMRARISPASLRSTASGLIRISDRSSAIERTSLLGASSPSGRSYLEGRELHRCRLHRGLAVRTHLPERFQGRLAIGAGLLELRGADRTDEELVRHLGPADAAVEGAAGETLLHRLDLELALAHVLEVLRRPEQHVHERAEVWDHEADRHGGGDQDRILDAPLRVLVDPVADREPERDQEEEEQVENDVPGIRRKEVVDPAEGAGDHRRILPIRYPARNASPTIAASTNAANAKTVSLSPTFAIVGFHPWRDRPRGKGSL